MIALRRRKYDFLAVTSGGQILCFRDHTLVDTLNTGEELVGCGNHNGCYTVIGRSGKVWYSNTGDAWRTNSVSGRNIVMAASRNYDVIMMEEVGSHGDVSEYPLISRCINVASGNSVNVLREYIGSNGGYTLLGTTVYYRDCSGVSYCKEIGGYVYIVLWHSNATRMNSIDYASYNVYYKDVARAVYSGSADWSVTTYGGIYNRYNNITSALLYDYIPNVYAVVNGNTIASESRKFRFSYFTNSIPPSQIHMVEYHNKVYVNSSERIDGWYMYDVDYINGKYVLALGKCNAGGGYYDFDTFKLVYSTNLTSFADAMTVSIKPNRLRTIRGVMYCACNNGYLYKSTDGVNWTQVSTGTTAHIRDIA